MGILNTITPFQNNPPINISTYFFLQGKPKEIYASTTRYYSTKSREN